MKLLGSVLLLCSGLGWGLYKACGLAARERALGELQKMMQGFLAGIQYSAWPLVDLVRQGDSPFCREAAAQAGFLQDPRRALLQAGERLLARQGDREFYRGFVEGLGKSDAQGQLGHIRLHAAMLERLLEEARQEREGRARLYVSLGLSGGAALCLLLL